MGGVVKVCPYKTGGGGALKGFNHAEGGGGTTSFEVVLSGTTSFTLS